MKLLIVNEELKKLDEEVYRFNSSFGLVVGSLNNIPNTFAANKILELLENLKLKAEKLELENEFDILVKENIINNLESQKIFITYFALGKVSIDKLFETMLGIDSLNYIKNCIINFDYESAWKFALSYEKYAYSRIPSDDEKLRAEFNSILIELKKDILDYGHKNFGLPNDYDFDLVLGQPYSNRTYFNPRTKRMEIAPDAFFAFKENNLIKINSSLVIEELFHEFIGHGRHEFNSRNMPHSIKDDSINLIEVAHIHAEGVSQFTKKDSIKFMRLYKEKYKIEEDYISQRELSDHLIYRTSFSIYYKYLELKSLEDKNIDPVKELSKIANNWGVTLQAFNANTNILTLIHDSIYMIGLDKMEKIIGNIKNEYGSDFIENNASTINEAISTGIWNHNVLPKFVSYFIKKSKG